MTKIDFKLAPTVEEAVEVAGNWPCETPYHLALSIYEKSVRSLIELEHQSDSWAIHCGLMNVLAAGYVLGVRNERAKRRGRTE
jgi:hypothetical protein